MLVICEDCAAKYNVDENRMESDRARFSCRKCGHTIFVKRPVSPARAKENAVEQMTPAKTSKTQTVQESMPADRGTENKIKQKKKPEGRSLSLRFYLFLIPVIVFLSMAAAFTFFYFKYIPQLMDEQIDLRISAISTMFSGTIQKPLLIRNFLEVNQEAKKVAQLPGVAYAAVVNERGIIVAGFFDDLTRFEPGFADRVKTAGFPREIVEENKLLLNVLNRSVRFNIGGKEILDRADKLTEAGGTIHVGLYLADFYEAIERALFSPFAISLIAGIFLTGMLLFIAIARFIGTPLIKLTSIVNRISLGELDLTITPSGPKEVRELGRACERMRYSVKNAIERLRKNR